MDVLVAADEHDSAAPEQPLDLSADQASPALWVLLAVSVAVYLVDRGWGAWTADLRVDENLTGWITSGSFGEAVSRSWNYQGQSPLYFMGLWVWEQIFGSTEMSLRTPSLIALAIAAWQLVGVGRDLGRVRAGQVGAALFVSMGVGGFEARPYIFMLLALIVSARAGLRWAAGGSSKLGFVWAISGAIAIYFQPFAIYALLPSVAISVAAYRRGRGRELLGLIAIGGLALVPLIPQVLALRARQETLVTVPMPTFDQLVAALLPTSMTVALVFAIADYLLSKREDVRLSIQATQITLAPSFVLLWMVLPASGLFVQSHLTGDSVFLGRYFVASSPAFALGAGLLLSKVSQLRMQAGILVVVLLSAYIAQPTVTRDWRPAVVAINSLDSTTEVWTEAGYIESNHAQYFNGQDNEYLSAPLLWHGAEHDLIAVPRLAIPDLIPILEANLDRVIEGSTPVLLVEESLYGRREDGPVYLEDGLISAGFMVADRDDDTFGVMTTLYTPPTSAGT